jgi:hypothetical protein
MQGTLKRQHLCMPNEPDDPLSIRNSRPKPKAPKTGTALNFSSPPTQSKEAKRQQIQHLCMINKSIHRVVRPAKTYTSQQFTNRKTQSANRIRTTQLLIITDPQPEMLKLNPAETASNCCMDNQDYQGKDENTFAVLRPAYCLQVPQVLPSLYLIGAGMQEKMRVESQ